MRSHTRAEVSRVGVSSTHDSAPVRAHSNAHRLSLKILSNSFRPSSRILSRVGKELYRISYHEPTSMTDMASWSGRTRATGSGPASAGGDRGDRAIAIRQFFCHGSSGMVLVASANKLDKKTARFGYFLTLRSHAEAFFWILVCRWHRSSWPLHRLLVFFSARIHPLPNDTRDIPTAFSTFHPSVRG